MGWFAESDEERKKRLRDERISQQKAISRQKKAEQRKKRNAEFQQRINEEVAKNLEERSPDSKRSRLEQLHGSSSLLNSALGLEFAQKGRPATPWQELTRPIKHENTIDKSTTTSTIMLRQLNRPF